MGNPFTLFYQVRGVALSPLRSYHCCGTGWYVRRCSSTFTWEGVRLFFSSFPPLHQWVVTFIRERFRLCTPMHSPLHSYAFTFAWVRGGITNGTRWQLQRCLLPFAPVRGALYTRARSPLQRCEVVFGKVLFPFGGLVVHKSGCLFVRSEDLTSL